MGQSKLFQPDAFHFQSTVHINYSLDAGGRPESFCNSNSARPDPRIDGFRGNILAPHGRFSSQDMSTLFCREITVGGDGVDVIV